MVGSLLQFFPTQSQPLAVHTDHSQHISNHFKKGTGKDGPAVVVGHCKQGAVYHIGKGGPAQNQRILRLHGGQLGKLLRVDALNVELADPALDMNGKAIGGNGYNVVGQPPDDIAEQPGRQHQRTLFHDLGGDGGLDAGFQVVAGEAQGLSRLHQNALHGRDGAFGGYSA